MIPYFHAHAALSTCRDNGVIPWTALDTYMRRHPELGDFNFFEGVVYGIERVIQTLEKMKRDASNRSSGKPQAGNSS